MHPVEFVANLCRRAPSALARAWHERPKINISGPILKRFTHDFTLRPAIGLDAGVEHGIDRQVCAPGEQLKFQVSLRHLFTDQLEHRSDLSHRPTCQTWKNLQ